MEYEGHAVSDVIEYTEHTQYGAILEGLIQAMKRIKDKVGIQLHVNNAVLASQIKRGSFEKWQRNGGITSRGSPVAEWKLWEAVYRTADDMESRFVSADTEIPREKRTVLAWRIKKQAQSR